MSILKVIRRSIIGSALAAGLIASSASVPAWAQSQSINGTIRGHATDATGADIPDAIVSISNAEVGYSNQISTGSDGYFVQPNLPLGTYKVTISKDGFSTLKYDSIVLNAGKEVVLDAKLARRLDREMRSAVGELWRGEADADRSRREDSDRSPR